MTADEPAGYAFDSARAAQDERLRTLEPLFDPGTIGVLEARGVASRWRCLEVGAGGGSIALWLSDRVAPDSAVLATDLDLAVLGSLSRPNLEVRVRDVMRDDLPESAFDLVHARLLLAWLSDPPAALRRLIAALKPGGWLVAEDLDFVSAVADPRMDADQQALSARAVDAHNAVLAELSGFDTAYGRRVAGDLADAGLAEGGCQGRASMWRGGEAGGRAWHLTLAQLREPLIASGRMNAAEVDAAVALCDDPGFSSLSPVLMAAWGRRPL